MRLICILGSFGQLLMGLLRRGDPDPGSGSELLALAAECLDQLPRRDQTLVEAIKRADAILVRLADGQVMTT